MLLDFFRFWTPPEKLRELRQIHQSPPSLTLSPDAALVRIHYTVFAVCLCLLALYYLKNYSALQALCDLLGAGPALAAVQQGPFGELLRHTWWSLMHLVWFLILPAVFILLVLKGRPRHYGLEWNQTHRHWRGYAFLLAPIVVMAVLASQRPDFSDHYPFYKAASRSWLDLLLWELCYLVQFLSLEFFFRGFMLQALRPAVGAMAIWVMVPPYLMIHFGKPWLEATGAIFFGLFLGILALQNRSIWGGFLVHCGVALSMDIAALMQQNALPQQAWP
jgi:uncharacterized protein